MCGEESKTQGRFLFEYKNDDELLGLKFSSNIQIQFKYFFHIFSVRSGSIGVGAEYDLGTGGCCDLPKKCNPYVPLQCPKNSSTLPEC